MEWLLKDIPIESGLRPLFGAGFIVAVTILAALIVRFVIYVVVVGLTKRTKTELDNLLLLGTRSYVNLLVYLFGMSVLFNYLESLYGELYGEKIFIVIDGINYAAGVIVVALMLVNILTISLRWKSARLVDQTRSAVSEELVPLIERVAKLVVFIVASLTILDYFHVDVKGLVAVLGIGSLAIALASQETVANMIGAFVIMIDRPFRIGDRIKRADGTVCVVQQIGMRSTRMLTFDNSLIIIPNAELMKSTIHNLSYPTLESPVKIELAVAYDSDLSVVRKILLSEAAQHPNVLTSPAPDFAFRSFGENGLNVTLVCRVADIAQDYQTGNELRESILAAFRAQGIEFALPHRVVTLVQPDGTPDSNKA
ncbi:MAG: mechanosensitive ion channel family protein [candidate division Zixibacteria bacterium]|nr:mechanosensitive ion channel family protein [candidate division Zixibacteria bacterium]